MAIAGVDEVGRGPLAGPVAAAAVILDPAHLPAGLDDSKKLSADMRESLFADIVATALAVSFGMASAAEIDAINIRMASLLAMRRAVAALSLRADYAIVDGRDVPPGLPCAAHAIIGGDGICLSIAAASIVAKVMRDRLMRALHVLHPAFGFDTNVGYATAYHRQAIARVGPTPFHRMSFSPMRPDPQLVLVELA